MSAGRRWPISTPSRCPLRCSSWRPKPSELRNRRRNSTSVPPSPSDSPCCTLTIYKHQTQRGSIALKPVYCTLTCIQEVSSCVTVTLIFLCLSAEPVPAAAKNPAAGQSRAEPEAEDRQRDLWAVCQGEAFPDQLRSTLSLCLMEDVMAFSCCAHEIYVFFCLLRLLNKLGGFPPVVPVGVNISVNGRLSLCGN